MRSKSPASGVGTGSRQGGERPFRRLAVAALAVVQVELRLVLLGPCGERVSALRHEEVGAADDGKRPGLMDVRSVVERALGDGFVEE